MKLATFVLAFTAAALPGLSQAQARTTTTTAATTTSTPEVSVTLHSQESADQFIRSADATMTRLGGWLQSTTPEVDPRTGATNTTFVFGFRDPESAGGFLPSIAVAPPPATGFHIKCGTTNGNDYCHIEAFGFHGDCVKAGGRWICVEW